MIEKRFSNTIPIEALYQPSRKEASRKKPVFFVHKYFARRITSNYRAALLDYLYDDNSIIQHFYEPSIKKGTGITILDPFMGGGTVVFEALRFGCNVIGNDLQPLSLFATKALVMPIDEKAVMTAVKRIEETVGNTIKGYYETKCPSCGLPADGMYAFHVKKIRTNSSCKYHRFFSTFVLAYKNNTFTVVCPKCGKVEETKFEDGKYICKCGWVLNSPKESYVNNGVFECPDCHEKRTLSEYQIESGYPFMTDIVAIEYCCPHCKAHGYKSPDSTDIMRIKEAERTFDDLELSLPIPQQDIPVGYNTNQILNHGYKKFKDLFNKRQLLCLGLLLRTINSYEDKEIQFWLQLAFSGMLEMNNMFCRYQQNAYKICNIFFNHAYVPIAMPVENCVWGAKLGTGTFIKTIEKILRGKRFNSDIYDLATKKVSNGRYDSIQIRNGDKVLATPVSTVNKLSANKPVLHCSDSRDLSFIPDESIDLVLTDPPYGANVMYSELIDFFHVWNHKSSISEEIGFTSKLAPKSDEIIVNSTAGKDFEYYKNGITAVLTECHKKLKPEGYLAFSFHDKSIDSWLAVLESIFSAGFILEKVYPVQSETRTGAHTSGKNSIGIDIMLISKKAKRYASIKQKITDDRIKEIIEKTRKDILSFLECFHQAEAEITAPDIQNMEIAIYFMHIKNYLDYDMPSKQKIINTLLDLLENIKDFVGDFEISEKRKGWWSELYRELMNP